MTFRARRSLLLLTTTFLAAACSFEFERDAGLEPGDVAGRALRTAEEPAAYARAHVNGSGREQRTRSDGSFLIRGLVPGGFALELFDDKNGDGWPERASRRTFTVTRAAHAQGLFGEREEATTWVNLGDVRLDGVVEAEGRVLRHDGTPAVGARVFALRRATLPAGGDDRGALSVELSADADTATDIDGRFHFPALPAGTLTFVAFSAEDTPRASVPVARDASPGAELADITLELEAATDTRPVRIELVPAPAPGELVRAHVVLPGATPPAIGEGTFALGEPGVEEGGPRLLLDVPLGAWDVWVETSRGRFGVLRRQVASLPGDDTLTWGLLLLGTDDACVGTAANGDEIRDCDHDGLQGLPVLDSYDDPRVAIWRECAPACAEAFGEAALGASCTAGGEVYDCDDDGDGQSDVTEALGCYGPGRGADPDGDGLCGAADPYPQCRENDPAHENCRAGASLADFPPGVRADLLDDDVDAGPGDGGDDDGGVLDGGDDDDGGSDGGADGGVDAGPAPFVDGLGYASARDSASFGGGVAVIVESSYDALDLGGCVINGEREMTMVALLDERGDCRWSVKAGTASELEDAGMYERAYFEQLTVLPSGELLVAGSYYGEQIVVTSASGDELAVASNTAGDLLLFTIDPTGTVTRLVVGNFGGDNPSGFNLYDVVPFADGGFLLTGELWGALTVDIGGTTTTIGSGSFMTHMLMLAFDASFTPVWTHAGVGVEGSVRARGGVTVGEGAAEHVIALVTFDSLVNVDGVGQLHSGNSGALLLLAFPTTGAEAGTLAWHRRIDGPEDRESLIAPNGQGGFLLVASSAEPVTLDGDGDGGPGVETDPIGKSLFIASYDASGALLEHVEASGHDGQSRVEVRALQALPGGELLLGGNFYGGFTLGDVEVPDAHLDDVSLFATRLHVGGALDVAYLQRSYGLAELDTLALLPDESTLVFGRARGQVYFGGLRFDVESPDGESVLWRILPDGTSAEELLLGFGEGCSTSGACASRRCGLPPWPTVEDGLCVSRCDLANPTCPEASTCQPASQLGSDGVCVPDGGCFEDAHCGTGRCNPYTLACEPGCVTADDCTEGQACHPELSVCVRDCFADGACLDGEVCAPSGGGYACVPDCNVYGLCGGFCGGDGMCSDGDFDVDGVLGDTWTWDPSTRAFAHVETSTQPGPRRGHALAASGDGVVVVGGFDGSNFAYGATTPYVFQGGNWQAWGSSVSNFDLYVSAAAGDPTAGGDGFYLYGLWDTSDVLLRLPCCGQNLEMTSTSFPSPSRLRSAMAFDGVGRVWLFGGSDGETVHDDLWSFDTTAPGAIWELETPAVRPAARYDHALSYTGVPGQLLLTGGRGVDGRLLDDTWRLTVSDTGGPQWSAITGAELGPRAGHGMAWDGTRVVIYGGATSRARTESRDVLEFDEASQRWHEPRLGAAPPPPRTGVRMAFDGTQIVLYGGERGARPVHVYDDVDVATVGDFGEIDWEPRTPTAPPAEGAAFALDPDDGALWVFGGRDPLGALTNQLHVYFPSGDVEELPVSTDGPSAREGAAMAFHPVTGELFLFGGRDATGQLNDVWRYDDVTGFEPGAVLAPWPEERSFAAMAPSFVDGKILLFGGERGRTPLGDLWFLTEDGLFEPAPVGIGGPSARTEVAVTSGPEGVYLFGGFGRDAFDFPTTHTDLWVWSGLEGGGWTSLVSSGWFNRGGATISYEPGSSPARLWVFGGNDGTWVYGSEPYYDASWGMSWTYLLSEDARPRSRHAAGFVGGRLLVVGGSDEPRDLLTLAPEN